jgi:hypothetical protein
VNSWTMKTFDEHGNVAAVESGLDNRTAVTEIYRAMGALAPTEVESVRAERISEDDRVLAAVA